ncbi:MAG: O-antigen ligase like membrane protein [Rhodobacteraceae bacterium HLUCCO18]|nr:MAG: O-antigen ligase like membrane protein [Rhodobacteraceae bacterium HLUCCO18]
MAAVASSSSSRRILGVPVPVALFFVAMMLPTAVSVNLGGLRLSAYRMVLIVMFLPMLVQLLSGRKGRMHLFDLLVLAHCGWAILALIKWGGLAQGIESGGIYVVEFAGAYLLARLYVRSYEDFAAVARAYVMLVLATLIFTVPEALTGIHILHDGISGALGGPMAPYIDPRMGLERTFGPFDHPILYGVFSASAFSLAYFVIAERRLMNFKGMAKVIGVGLATFMSASGGPYVVLMMQGFVAAWERVLGKIKGRWAALFSLFGLTYIAIDLFSTKTPFHVFVNNFTFSPQSAYNRILIFEFGTAEVARHPIFGIGLGDWERPSWMSDSMDNFWLVVAVRYGLPAFLMLVALLLGLIWTVGQRKNLPPEWRRARHAWAFTLFGITVAAATVHLWNALFVLFLFLIGAGAWLLDARPEPQNVPGPVPAAKPKLPARALRPARLF